MCSRTAPRRSSRTEAASCYRTTGSSCRRGEVGATFIGPHAPHADPLADPLADPHWGDVWTSTAIDADTKLVPSRLVGERTDHVWKDRGERGPSGHRGAVGSPTVDQNLLYYGDNLDVLRRHVSDESVDLVYLDPPFNSKASYNVLFTEHGAKSAAQINAFKDTWHWDDAAALDYQQTVEQGGTVAAALRALWG